MAVLPSIRLLRALHPACRLTLVCREEYGEVLLRTGAVDELEPESRPRFSGLFSGSGPIPEESASWLGRFDRVWGWMQSPGKGDLEGTLDHFGKAYRFLRYDPASDLTVSRFFFEATARLLSPAGSPRISFEECFFLQLTDAEKDVGFRLAGKLGLPPASPYAVIHPGSGGRAKRWPLDRFLEVAVRLSGRNVAGVFVTGEAEADLAVRLDQISLPPRWVHVSNPDIMNLAGLLARSALYFGNDCGVSHLAAACGTKVIAVFRKETEAAWTPGGRTMVISARDTASVPLDSVLSAAGLLLSSS